MASEDPLSSEAGKIKASKDCMHFLGLVMSSMKTYLRQKYEGYPRKGRPFEGLWAIEYEEVMELTTDIRAQLALFGQLKEAKEVVGTAEVGEGVWLARPKAKKHLEKRNESKPDQPKREVDAKREADWLEAAMTMRAVQIHVRDFALDDDMEEEFGIQTRRFCQNLQLYVWIFLGQGSEEGLPWYQNPEWRKWRLARSVHPHPDLTKVFDMWHNGLDIYDILERLGPSSEVALLSPESVMNRKTAYHGSPGPSN